MKKLLLILILFNVLNRSFTQAISSETSELYNLVKDGQLILKYNDAYFANFSDSIHTKDYSSVFRDFILDAPNQSKALSDCQEAKIKLIAEINLIKQENDRLKEEINNLKVVRSKEIPTQISYSNVSHDYLAYIMLDLDKIGSTKIEVFDINNNEIWKDKIEFNKSPIYKVENLLPLTKYSINAHILDFNGKTIKSEKYEFQTTSRQELPYFSIKNTKISSNEINLELETREPELLIQIDCIEWEEGTDGTPITKSIYSLNREVIPNKFGLFEVDRLKPIQILRDVKANTKYQIKVTAYNKYGQKYYNERFVKTEMEPIRLSFGKKVEINYNTLESQISWETTKEAKEAYISFYLGTDEVRCPASFSQLEKSYTAKIEHTKFTSLFDQKRITNQIPEFSIIMKDEKENIVKSIKTLFTIPTKDQIVMSKGIPDEKREELIKASGELIDAVSGKKSKIDWAKVVKVGIPILLKVI